MRSRLLIPMMLCLTAAPAHAQAAGALPANCTSVSPLDAARQPRYSQAQLDSQEVVRNARNVLREDLRTAARAAGIAEPVGLIFVERNERRPGAARVWSFRSNVPDALSRTVMARNAEPLARLGGRDRPIHVRVDESAATLDSVTYECTPVLLDPDQMVRALTRIIADSSSFPSRRPGSEMRPATLHLVMLVTQDGYVAHAELKRSTRHRNLERELLQVARRLRFRPATIENVPMDVWVEQPVGVLVPEP